MDNNDKKLVISKEVIKKSCFSMPKQYGVNKEDKRKDIDKNSRPKQLP